MSIATDNPTREVSAKNNLAPTIEDKDIYRTVFDTRNFEISLFWQRSNYFLVLNTALAVGFFSLKTQEWPAFLLAAFGFITSLLWFRVVLGGKYWQSRWEQRLSIIERQISANLNLFSADWQVIQGDVEENLKNNQSGCFKKWLEKQVLKKHSVSYNMVLLSLCFAAGWVLLGIIRIWRGGLLVG